MRGGIRKIVVAVTAGVFCMLGALDAEEFNPRKVVKPFPAITNPKMVSGAKAREVVRDEELVLGVAVGGEAHAYPINQLTNPTREIINDSIGGRAIAATW